MKTRQAQAGVAFLVMEHLEGETIAERLTSGALSPQQTLAYGIQILRNRASRRERSAPSHETAASR